MARRSWLPSMSPWSELHLTTMDLLGQVPGRRLGGVAVHPVAELAAEQAALADEYLVVVGHAVERPAHAVEADPVRLGIGAGIAHGVGLLARVSSMAIGGIDRASAPPRRRRKPTSRSP